MVFVSNRVPTPKLKWPLLGAISAVGDSLKSINGYSVNSVLFHIQEHQLQKLTSDFCLELKTGNVAISVF